MTTDKVQLSIHPKGRSARTKARRKAKWEANRSHRASFYSQFQKAISSMDIPRLREWHEGLKALSMGTAT